MGEEGMKNAKLGDKAKSGRVVFYSPFFTFFVLS